MSNELKDANLDLLIGLKQHLEHAAKLRTILHRLLSLAKPPGRHNTTKEPHNKCKAATEGKVVNAR